MSPLSATPSHCSLSPSPHLPPLTTHHCPAPSNSSCPPLAPLSSLLPLLVPFLLPPPTVFSSPTSCRPPQIPPTLFFLFPPLLSFDVAFPSCSCSLFSFCLLLLRLAFLLLLSPLLLLSFFFCSQDAEGVPIDVQVSDNGDGTFYCVYVPTKPIKHTILVTWGQVNVPSSPFRVITPPRDLPSVLPIVCGSQY